MHTTTVRVDSHRPGYPNEWTINHNSDWSGDAILSLNGKHFAVLPGKLLKEIGRKAAIEEVISKLEAML